MASAGEKPLRKMADAFEGLAASSKASAMEVASFSHACAQVSFLFGCLGMAFRFAEKDYVSKVEDLKAASQSISTLQSMLESDVQQNTVRQGGSHSRNLLRVLRGVDMVRVLFDQILVTEGNSLRDAASAAYTKVFAPHHGWAIRKAVSAGLFALPSKSQLLKKLNEDEATAKLHMQKFVTSAAPVIQYVEELFISRELGIDW